jgi:hypothetical protein
MKYIFLIYSDEANNPAPDSVEFGEIMAGYNAFNEEAQAAGILVAGEPLEPVAAASTVSVRDGVRSVTDGPFAETKEQLGGFYILDCKDLDQALSFAAKIPSAKHGRIEVRPIWEHCGGE